MSLSIRTNVSSLNAQRNLASTQSALDSSLSRLSSGFRITKAGDDAAGLGISTKLESQIRSYNQATRNANDGISVVQSTEAALNEQANILTRMRELAMQSASDGVGNVERGYINQESTKLLAELQRISQVAEYNGTKLLDGSAATLDFQVGIAATANDVISLTTLNGTTAAPVPPGAPAMAAVLGAASAAYVASMGSVINLTTASNAAGSAAAALAGGSVGTEVAGLNHEVFLTGYYSSGGAFQIAINTPPAGAGTTGGVALVGATAGGGTGGSTVLPAAYGAYAADIAGGGSLFSAFAAAQTAAQAPGAALGISGVELASLQASAATAAQHVYAAAWYQAGGVGAPDTTAGAARAAGLAALAGTWAAAGAPASAGGLGVAGLSLSTKGAALSALASIDSALGTISSNRATLGAAGNRFQSAIANIQSFSESLSAANSRIKDVDVAEETSRMSRSQILMQAGVSVLAQANQQPQLALKLLG